MAGGGAGKVYFVLYLAVVLELLIIIVERDEAEEGLLSKQKETMKIVESILSQLQAGSGSEAINTRPQDEIMLPPEGVSKDVIGFEIRPDRTYLIEVGVTDISADIARREGETEKEYSERLLKLIKLGNVMDLEYQIFYNSSEDQYNAPAFPNEAYIKDHKIDFATYQPGQQFSDDQGNTWQFMGMQKLVLDEVKTFNNINLKNVKLEGFEPIYPNEKKVIVGPTYAPPNISSDSIFYYSKDETRSRSGSTKDSKLAKRVFFVKFQPDKGRGGWYKLRFNSHTSKILGVRKDAKPAEVSDETKVNIGTVQLAVKDLRKVLKELGSKLEEYALPSSDMLIEQGKYDKFIDDLAKAKANAVRKAEDPQTIASNIDLYGYIVQLLAPGQSVNFSQNKGSIDFNIRVVKPNIGTPEPAITVKDQTKFEQFQMALDFDISPYSRAGENKIEGHIFQGGSEVAKLTDIKPYQVYKGGTVPDYLNNKSVRFVGFVDKKLPAGQYTMKIVHGFKGKVTDETRNLYVCEAGLNDQSEKKIKGIVVNRAFYGKEIYFGAVPKSDGQNIAASEFRIYLRTDKNMINQSGYVQGLDIPQGGGLKLTSGEDSVVAKVVWVDPITDKEVILYQAQSAIEQQQPTISFMRAKMVVTTTSLEEGQIEITGITVLKSQQSNEPGDFSQLEINANASGDLSGRTPNSKYTYKLSAAKCRPNDDKGRESADVTVIIPFKLAPNENINRRDKQIALSGNISVSVISTAINTKNGKRSKALTISQGFNPSTTIGSTKSR